MSASGTATAAPSPSSAGTSTTLLSLGSTAISSVLAPTITSTERTNEGPRPSGTGEGRPRDNRPIASSAALYLYTFLATLVLLLSVSAAIVIRSFILRRRHRRLVEEAIRNGTWVPPTPPGPGGGRGPRVDLSKKPVMWEAYLGNNEHDVGYEEPREWDSIKPVSAAYLAPTVVPDQQAASTKTAAEPVPTRTLGSRVQSFGMGMRSGFRWLVGLPPRPAYDSSANESHINLDAAPVTGDSKIPTNGPDGGPPVVRVSVIIAMPRPRSTPSPPPPPPPNIASSSSAGILSPTNDHPLSSHLQQRSPHLEEEEEFLPVMEMGVAELVVVDHEAEARKARESALLAMDVKEPIGRDSVSMTVEV